MGYDLHITRQENWFDEDNSQQISFDEWTQVLSNDKDMRLDNFAEAVLELKKQFSEAESARYFDNWIPRQKLMEFFDYGDTKIAELFKQGELQVSEVGIRKFIKKESVLKFLEKNLKK